MSGETMEKWLADASQRIAELESAWRGASSMLTDAQAENERLKRGRDRLVRVQEELIEENKRLRHAVKRTQEEGRWTYGEFFEVDEEALAELDAAMGGE